MGVGATKVKGDKMGKFQEVILEDIHRVLVSLDKKAIVRTNKHNVEIVLSKPIHHELEMFLMMEPMIEVYLDKFIIPNKRHVLMRFFHDLEEFKRHLSEEAIRLMEWKKQG